MTSNTQILPKNHVIEIKYYIIASLPRRLCIIMIVTILNITHMVTFGPLEKKTLYIYIYIYVFSAWYRCEYMLLRNLIYGKYL